MATPIEDLYVGDGSTVLYSFTFPYIAPEDIKVTLDGTLTTGYTFANITTVEFNTAPLSGVAIRIYRNTQVDDIENVFYPGSAIRAKDLNDNFTQSLFVIQEADINVDTANNNADAAVATANAAVVTANAAETSAAAAQVAANQAQTDATQAAADAASAQADATQAAADAVAAQISADQANTAVQAAAIFSPVANVAAIPASPADQDRVSVIDSTGIASFTPLTGLPVGPTYDSGVYVNLVYQASGFTWEFVAYGPNDPDSRYLIDTADSVSTSNIANNAVTTDKVIDAAVTTDKLGTDSVTTDKLSTDSVTTDKVLDTAVTSAKLADNAVTPAKLDRTYVDTTGDTMTGGLIVPSLSSPSGHLPIERATVADSQVQSFQFQSDDSAWYPFDPIPDWCNHIRYNISALLSITTINAGGFYLRFGTAAGPLIATTVSNAYGTKGTVVDNAGNLLYNVEPFVIFASSGGPRYTDYLMDFYIYNRGINGLPGYYMYGIGSGVYSASPLQAEVSETRMYLQHITPQSPNTIMPDRLGCLLYGGSASGSQNKIQIKQTFLTDGPTGSQAELGPTPTPIPKT